MLNSPRTTAVQQVFRPLERAGVVILLSVTSGAYLAFIQETLGVGARADLTVTPLAHMILLPLYACMGLVILTNPKAFLRAVWHGRFAVALVGLAGLSTLWSMDPGLTLRRSISLLAPTGLGLLIAARYTSAEMLRLLAIALGIPAILSLIVVLLMPAEGISSIEYGNAWKGVYAGKNGLGRAMALGVGVFTLLALEGGRGRWLAWLGTIGLLGLALMSRSMGSIVTAVALLILIPLFRSLRLKATIAFGVWTVSILAALIFLTLFVANTEVVFPLLGRDATLTGRTQIWMVVVGSIQQQPWLGHGYSAFWQAFSGSLDPIMSSVGWETPNSHNGLLDLWLELGLIGVVVLLLGFGVAAHAALLRARHATTPACLWPLVFLSFMVLINISSSTLLGQHSSYWILYAAVLSSSGLRSRAVSQVARRRESIKPPFWSPSVGRASRGSPGILRLYRVGGQRD